MKLTIDEMATFCKKKGFIYQNSEIYGGLSGFFDYGPCGSELKNNIKQQWWKTHVHGRPDVTGIDGSIVNSSKVWEASGHVANFSDIMLECGKCKNKVRADHLVEDKLKIPADGMTAEQLQEKIKENKIGCPKCGSALKEPSKFNLMFETNVGPVKDDKSTAYLRPETAQLMFTNFKLVQENSRLKLPFGIAQMGRAFRNEISPRDFLFRCREFEMMEIEYFVHPEKINDCPYLDEFLDYEINILSAEMQEKEQKPKKMKIKDALDKKIIKTTWHAHWLAFEHNWFVSLGASPDNFRIRQHLSTEKSHYALDTWDLEYNFPFGWKELQGMANRTDFDLQQHIKVSGKDLSYFDQDTKKKVIPHVVAEPSQGVERAFLVFMFDAYNDDKKRGNIVLNLHPKLAPFKAAIFPLVSNKEELLNLAKDVYNDLKQEFNCLLDTTGSVGRRYARADELGTPLCITIDFDSSKDNTVTVRSRDTTAQIRVQIEDLSKIVRSVVNGEQLEKLGKVIK
ncbi:MAG: glycine--tRNA ligase [bacterium]|nr:glycine--tRNA ligase [bacterium]